MHGQKNTISFDSDLIRKCELYLAFVSILTTKKCELFPTHGKLVENCATRIRKIGPKQNQQNAIRIATIHCKNLCIHSQNNRLRIANNKFNKFTRFFATMHSDLFIKSIFSIETTEFTTEFGGCNSWHTKSIVRYGATAMCENK